MLHDDKPQLNTERQRERENGRGEQPYMARVHFQENQGQNDITLK